MSVTVTAGPDIPSENRHSRQSDSFQHSPPLGKNRPAVCAPGPQSLCRDSTCSWNQGAFLVM